METENGKRPDPADEVERPESLPPAKEVKQPNLPLPETETKGLKPIGRTLGDVVHEVVTSPRNMSMFFVFCGTIAVLCMALMWVFIHVFGLVPSEAELGDKGSHVVFQQVQAGTGNGVYFVIVSPEGWQRTSIPVHAGDQLTFTASGRVCIDLGDILDKVNHRKTYEEEIANARKIRADDPKETRVPEDYFTDEQRKNLTPNRPWVDPDGFNLDDPQFKPSFLSRKKRYLLPGEPAGGLAAAIMTGVKEPEQKNAFFVGASNTFSAPTDGELWFTVNDVQFNDPNNKNLFYNDNIGSFWVKVSVKHI
jgi:hypothetical protein